MKRPTSLLAAAAAGALFATAVWALVAQTRARMATPPSAPATGQHGDKPHQRAADAFLKTPGQKNPARGTQVLVKLGDEVRAVLTAACPATLTFPTGGARAVELAWGTGASTEKAEAHFRALFVGPDGTKSVLLDETVKTTATDAARWSGREVALPAGEGTLELRTRGTSAAAYWAPPVFREGRHPPLPPRNVIVVSLDTTRADHLGAYGYTRRPTSPEFDAWAKEGALFLNAASASTGTLSSQMTILTGRYPSTHGVSYASWRTRGAIPVLPPKVTTLAEALLAKGYATAAFTGSGYFALPIGYARGFTQYVSTNDETLGGVANVFEKGFHWMERHRDRPFFLFLHTYEAHEPYLDHRFAYAERIGPQDWRARNEALYDGDIRRADDYVGHLRRKLAALGLADRTTVAIVSDHGEEFGEHFKIWNDGHGHGLYQEQVHVPFLLVGAGVPRGKRVPQAVDMTSVAPTVLEALGVGAPEGMDGRSVLGLLKSGPDPKEREWLAFSEDVWIGPATRAVSDGTWKLIEKGETLPEHFVDREVRRIIQQDLLRLPPRQLFDLGADPREKANRADAGPPRLAVLQTHLQARLPQRAAAEGSEKIEVDGEALERLRALGYVK